MSAPEPAGRPTGRVETGVGPACGNDEFGATKLTPVKEHPTTARPPRGRTARLREKLGERDMAVLDSLAKLRLLTGAQIQRLHVADGSAATQARRARALLQRLSDLRVVVRLGRRVGGIRAGSSGFVYGLSGHGHAVLAIDGHGGRRRRVWETSPSFQDHVLSVADTYIALVEAERRDNIELLDFDAEPACWRRFPGSTGQAVTLKPDAHVRLGVGELEHSAFVEVDLATESASTIALKCAVYLACWHSGLEQAANDVFPAVVWLTTTKRRVTQINAVLRRLPTDAQTIFRVGLLADAIANLTNAAGEARMA